MEESLHLAKRTRNTIEKIADIALEFLPITFSASDDGTGRKVYFPIPVKHNPLEMSDFIYIYAESKLSNTPKELDLGFTEDDVINATGVYVYKRKKDRVCGQVFPLGMLLQEVITDLSLRNRIIYRINEMKAMIQIDDDFLSLANLELSGTPPPQTPHKRLH